MGPRLFAKNSVGARLGPHGYGHAYSCAPPTRRPRQEAGRVLGPRWRVTARAGPMGRETGFVSHGRPLFHAFACALVTTCTDTCKQTLLSRAGVSAPPKTTLKRQTPHSVGSKGTSCKHVNCSYTRIAPCVVKHGMRPPCSLVAAEPATQSLAVTLGTDAVGDRALTNIHSSQKSTTCHH